MICKIFPITCCIFCSLFSISSSTDKNLSDESAFQIKSAKSKKVSHVLWVTWNSFWQKTNISGICNARDTSTGWKKKLWILVFVGFTISTIIGLSGVLKDYVSYPVITYVTVENHNQVNLIFSK